MRILREQPHYPLLRPSKILLSSTHQPSRLKTELLALQETSLTLTHSCEVCIVLLVKAGKALA